jgi:high-affinity K+ transport system ATPase subunit B
VFYPILHRLRGLFDVSRDTAPAPTHVRLLDRADDRLSGEVTLAERLTDGDCILLVPGDVIPCRGVVVDGFAVVRVDQSG